MLNWVSNIRVNCGIKSWVSNLCLSKYTQVHLEYSSTRIRKYLKPSIVTIEKGPQRSQYTSSKGALETWVLEEKESLFYYEKWHTS